MKRTFYHIISCIAFLALFSSCQQIKKSFEDTMKPRQQKDASDYSLERTGSSSSVTTDVTGPDDIKEQSVYASAEELEKIQAELMNLPKFKGKKIMMHQDLYFFDFQGGRISIKIQDPDKPENIDTYTYSKGKWLDPTPVKISGNLKMVDLLYPLDKVKFSTVKKIHDTLIEEAKDIEGGTPSDHVYFVHLKVANMDVTHWYSSISGARKDVYLYFDVDGNLTERR